MDEKVLSQIREKFGDEADDIISGITKSNETSLNNYKKEQETSRQAEKDQVEKYVKEINGLKTKNSALGEVKEMFIKEFGFDGTKESVKAPVKDATAPTETQEYLDLSNKYKSLSDEHKETKTSVDTLVNELKTKEENENKRNLIAKLEQDLDGHNGAKEKAKLLVLENKVKLNSDGQILWESDGNPNSPDSYGKGLELYLDAIKGDQLAPQNGGAGAKPVSVAQSNKTAKETAADVIKRLNKKRYG